MIGRHRRYGQSQQSGDRVQNVFTHRVLSLLLE
jgi:hypothetical protein